MLMNPYWVFLTAKPVLLLSHSFFNRTLSKMRNTCVVSLSHLKCPLRSLPAHTWTLKICSASIYPTYIDISWCFHCHLLFADSLSQLSALFSAAWNNVSIWLGPGCLLVLLIVFQQHPAPPLHTESSWGLTISWGSGCSESRLDSTDKMSCTNLLKHNTDLLIYRNIMNHQGFQLNKFLFRLGFTYSWKSMHWSISPLYSCFSADVTFIQNKYPA